MIRTLKSLRLSHNTMEDDQTLGGGSISIDYEKSLFSLIWDRIDGWQIITRIVISLILAKWGFEIYKVIHIKWTEIAVRRELRKNLEKENKLKELVELRIKNLSKFPQDQIQHDVASEERSIGEREQTTGRTGIRKIEKRGRTKKEKY